MLHRVSSSGLAEAMWVWPSLFCARRVRELVSRLARLLRSAADRGVELSGETDDLLGEVGVLRQQHKMLLSQRSLAFHHLGLTDFELTFASYVGLIVSLKGRVPNLVPVGLTRLRQQDQRRGVRRLG